MNATSVAKCRVSARSYSVALVGTWNIYHRVICKIIKKENYVFLTRIHLSPMSCLPVSPLSRHRTILESEIPRSYAGLIVARGNVTEYLNIS